MSESEAWVMIPKLDKDKTGCVLDMRPLVLCKDCKHKHSLTGTCVNIDGACFQSYVGDEWFCADGERKGT